MHTVNPFRCVWLVATIGRARPLPGPAVPPNTLLSTIPKTGKLTVQPVKKRKLGSEVSGRSILLPCKAIQAPWWEAGEALPRIVRLRCHLDEALGACRRPIPGDLNHVGPR